MYKSAFYVFYPNILAKTQINILWGISLTYEFWTFDFHFSQLFFSLRSCWLLLEKWNNVIAS